GAEFQCARARDLGVVASSRRAWASAGTSGRSSSETTTPGAECDTACKPVRREQLKPKWWSGFWTTHAPRGTSRVACSNAGPSTTITSDSSPREDAAESILSTCAVSKAVPSVQRNKALGPPIRVPPPAANKSRLGTSFTWSMGPDWHPRLKFATAHLTKDVPVPSSDLVVPHCRL